MSHLGKSIHPTNFKSIIEYSPAEYRKLRRQRNLWAIGVTLVTFAELALLLYGVYTHPIMFVAALVMIWPAWLCVLRAGEVSSEFRRNITVISRSFVRDVRRMLTKAARLRAKWPISNSFSVELSVMKFPDKNLNDMLLGLVPSNPSLVSGSYRVSPTSVTTVHGPDLNKIYDDLKQVLLGLDGQGAAELNILSQFGHVLPDADRTLAHASYGPLEVDSPTSMMGD